MAGPPPSPGWYPDPWAGGYHRYWDGSGWTGDSFPTTPVDPADQVDAQQAPPTLPRVTPPPPLWTPPPPAAAWPPPPVARQGEPTRPGWLSTGVGFVVLLVVMMLVVGSLAVVGAYYAFGGHRNSKPVASQPLPVTPTTPFPTAPGFSPGTTAPPSSDPSASALSGLVVKQADVSSTALVLPEPGGDQVSADPTINLCNGNFPSESSRTARLQVIAFDDHGNGFLSTEAVLYSSAAATAQAFTELKAAVAACPATPVDSPVGQPTVTTHFNGPPDGGWPPVPTVDRLAYDFTVTGTSRMAQHIVAGYLRRGRVLVGVYFYQPEGAQPSVAGQTTLAGITNVFATRLAQLPASVVGG